MQTRKKLDLDTLAVDSFATAAEDGARGTVRAHENEPDVAARGCTCQGTCLCPTAYYNCGTGPYTIYSCEYTANNSCHV
ncbi:pinensin family lanthipeptide [Longimicrobium sp.]|uniref:pinensin family lanthipeptide n=1 Tax=Longimicrobium sp. TaxID=2029185 RepID=UPI002B639E4B|nr:pinensin family lanthipeptide [Longimicrobium sp.]HSU15093.1 pinensin family lanthipeptide [Longimicrobium sp.]